MKGVQCYELFGGIALKIHTFSFFIFKGVLSGERSIYTGIPQGCILSPVLLTLHRNDRTETENTIFIKYSDDTAMVDLSNSIPHYMAEDERFTSWWKDNCLDHNLTKTKELLIGFRKTSSSSTYHNAW